MISKLYYYVKYLLYNKKELKIKSNTDNIILNEISDIRSFSITSSYFCKALSQLTNANVVSYHLILDPLTSKYKYFLNIINPFSSHYIYKSFSNKILYTFLDRYKHKKIFKNFKSKEDLLNLKYKNIEIGDLIYDEYLTRYKLSTIDIKSRQFKEFVRIVEKFIVYWDNYLIQNNVKAVVTSHSVYMMGMLNRLAIIHKIPSYLVTANATYRLTKKQFIKWSDQNFYPNQFKNFSKKQKDKLIKFSRQNLIQRLSGKKDFRYKMSNSIKPVFDSKIKIKKSKNSYKTKIKKILIASHCLSDAPHVYGKGIFTDFNDWLYYLGNISLKKKFKNYLWYIKPHPAFYEEEFPFYESLIKKYKNFKLLQKDISHNSIINNLNINYVLTVFGSIAHEYSLFDIPVISAGNNPHSGYNFSFNPKNINEYKKYLYNLNQISLKADKKKIYEFYGMHHLIDFSFFKDLNINFDSVADHQNIDVYKKFLKKINTKISQQKINIYQDFIKDKSIRRFVNI